MNMSIQVSRGKRQTIVDTLSRRIREGHYAPGTRLEGELRLAEEFSVSRGTIRDALGELQQRRMIATETGRGSFVIFDGQPLSQDRGWAQSMADTGSTVTTEILGIEPVERRAVPLLPTEVTLAAGIAIRRVRTLHREDEGPAPISFECATVPAHGRLADLPEHGLLDGSLSATLAAAGLHPARGTQRADVHLLDEREAGILHRDPGTAFLRTARTSFDVDGAVVEHVVSLLDPQHFTLSLSFGDDR
ncbi:GntR family transcriptional regulator [Brachybacterium sacelli]|uniref:GntR family transcriptional regulator n=1 Tax=Brachybacterium sacelli TaxID=173364 RepID=A0ABS4X6P0_9MICO|nr:GntR family transcriptional regulator [Brachybacterium sacelli]MBP2384100.1 GntR family transcriptional regulator [Brachybacterium sacelli]